MITIEINNSFCKAKGLNTAELRSIKDLLSYEVDDQARYFSGGWQTKRYLIDKLGSFPTGLLQTVLSHCKTQRYEYRTEDLRKAPKGNKTLYDLHLPVWPYLDQTDAVNAAIEAKRGTVSMVTGYGKSITIALLIKELGVKTLVVVPNLSLKQQLTDSFSQFFGASMADSIMVENIDSKALQSPIKANALIIDEVHHAAAKTYQKLNKTVWKDIYYRFGFTATPFRNNDSEQLLLKGIAGEVIHEVNYKKAVAQGAIVQVEAYYYDLPKIVTHATSWQAVYKELVVNHGPRNEIIAGLLQVLKAQGIPSLCLIKEINHGNILSDLTSIPFTNGQDEESGDFIHQFNSGVIKTLIGTTGVLGEGVDTKPAEYIIIAGAGKAKSAFMQQVGRGLRKYPGKESCKIVLFRDKSHKFMLRHFNAQCKILKEEYGVVPIKLELP